MYDYFAVIKNELPIRIGVRWSGGTIVLKTIFIRAFFVSLKLVTFSWIETLCRVSPIDREKETNVETRIGNTKGRGEIRNAARFLRRPWTPASPSVQVNEYVSKTSVIVIERPEKQKGRCQERSQWFIYEKDRMNKLLYVKS